MCVLNKDIHNTVKINVFSSERWYRGPK